MQLCFPAELATFNGEVPGKNCRLSDRKRKSTLPTVGRSDRIKLTTASCRNTSTKGKQNWYRTLVSVGAGGHVILIEKQLRLHSRPGP